MSEKSVCSCFAFQCFFSESSSQYLSIIDSVILVVWIAFIRWKERANERANEIRSRQVQLSSLRLPFRWLGPSPSDQALTIVFPRTESRARGCRKFWPYSESFENIGFIQNSLISFASTDLSLKMSTMPFL